ncbi:MAG: phosphate-starvation-inducible PsiE family protein [Ignavibacteria bacterium]|nr:phosphate-starvation-inducible PsiE family protein [Ignavibacteria bacterium]
MDNKHWVVRIQERFEKIIVSVLILMLIIVISFTTYDMGHRLFTAIFQRTDMLFQLEKDDIYKIFSAFLLVLIGIELLQAMSVYLKENAIHVETVLLVAIIAVARHLIDVNYEETDALKLIGFASLILSLTVGYFFIKKAIHKIKPEDDSGNIDNKEGSELIPKTETIQK